VSAPLELPADRPRPAVPSFKGALFELRVPAEIAAALTRLGRAEGATLFMVLLATFQVLLARLSGQDDIVVGSPIAGRTRQETQNLIGFFINTLVLRTRVDPALTFVDLLRQVRHMTLAAYAHQDVPFEKLVEELQPERDLAHQALFQAFFALQNLRTTRDWGRVRSGKRGRPVLYMLIFACSKLWTPERHPRRLREIASRR
jgi:condensation domain-containing protein